MKVELISFVLESQNDPKYFVPNGVTPLLPLKVLNPRRTSRGWSVDCFIARFERFERIFKGGYERWPNPVAWLEAEIDREECQNQTMRPWKLVVEEGEKEPKEPPVICWETLQRLKWFTSENYSQYPKPMFPLKPQPLKLHDIISPNSISPREPKRAKKDRKEREKAAKETITTAGLTGNDTSSGSTNQPATRRAWDKNLDDIHSGYTGDESDLASPISRKRKYNDDSRPQFTHYIDSDGEQFPTLKQLQHLHHIKQEKVVRCGPEEYLCGVSGREDKREKQWQKKRARYQSSPAPKFRMPPTMDMTPAPRLVEDKEYQLPIQPRSNAIPFKTPSSGPAQKSGSRGARRHHIFTTSSQEGDSDIEVIQTCDLPRPTTLKPQHISPTKSSASSSSRGNHSSTSMQERLNAFEHQHKIPNKEFNARYYDRLRSPSASSPEPQQNIHPNVIPDSKYNSHLHPMSGSSLEQDQLYPTIEFSPSLHTNDHSPSNKRSSQRIIEVVNLESPEPEARQGGAERSGSSPAEHRFNVSIASTETGFSGTSFKLDGRP
ncbi:uncharacterized protein K444DRAFT_618987 [Hyaloscypha bicolor E]|uniref:Uncharacterized protein n=1 Tax=Hyaloscypha bicolor E TaxID=1095630 RepID=A0A2J6SSM9_9HELO|nr:uncharacterized protein K444DRAFT_618987 [Hyaloscypha bicolor E]PMD53795.1 hypothetical protein K444DRAFT_618987 [Hyaloscypha bicolor E]